MKVHWDFKGCQFEIGDVATPEFKTIEQQVAKCQRYFYPAVPKGSAQSLV